MVRERSDDRVMRGRGDGCVVVVGDRMGDRADARVKCRALGWTIVRAGKTDRRAGHVGR